MTETLEPARRLYGPLFLGGALDHLPPQLTSGEGTTLPDWVAWLDQYAIDQKMDFGPRQLAVIHTTEVLLGHRGGSEFESANVFRQLKQRYAGRGSLPGEPCIVAEILGEVYAISTPHPWLAPLMLGVAGRDLEISGLPVDLLAKVSHRKRKALLDLARESQLHWVRLEQLAQHPKARYVGLAIKELKRAMFSTLPGLNDYDGARWSATHACEKLIKGVATIKGYRPLANQEKRDWRTHNISALASILERATGIRIPQQLITGFSVANGPSALRYQARSRFNRANQGITNTLRIASFLYLRTAATLPLDEFYQGDAFTEMDQNEPGGSVGMTCDLTLLYAEYPGIRKRAIWQSVDHGLYGNNLIEGLSQVSERSHAALCTRSCRQEPPSYSRTSPS